MITSFEIAEALKARGHNIDRAYVWRWLGKTAVQVPRTKRGNSYYVDECHLQQIVDAIDAIYRPSHVGKTDGYTGSSVIAAKLRQNGLKYRSSHIWALLREKCAQHGVSIAIVKIGKRSYIADGDVEKAIETILKPAPSNDGKPRTNKNTTARKKRRVGMSKLELNRSKIDKMLASGVKPKVMPRPSWLETRLTR